MKRRLIPYFIGFFLGTILVWALLIRDRNMRDFTSWTPNERILEEIRTDTALQLPADFWCRLNCIGFSSIDYDNLLENGNVDFSRSQTKGEEKIYLVSFSSENQGILEVSYLFSPAGRRVVEVNKAGEVIDCNCP